MRISTLKKRAEFQRVRGGGRYSTGCFVLEGKARTDDIHDQPRFGFTITKKIGGAVVRNRIRRRLKAALADLVNDLADPRFDYVLVARLPAFDRPFAELRTDLATAFPRVHDGARNPRATSNRKRTDDRNERPRGAIAAADKPVSRNS